MKCGHAANAITNKDGKELPCCAICCGLQNGNEEVDDNAPSLEGRFATCGGHSKVSSSTELAFFRYLPNQETDRYYCGCHGWD